MIPPRLSEAAAPPPPPPSAADGDAEGERHRGLLALTPDTPEALALLYQGLGDPSWRLRKAAMEALPRLVDEPQLVVMLIAGMAVHDNAGLRNSCAEALAAIGARALPELRAALGTADLDQRKFVVEVLGAIGGDDACAALLGALEQSDANVRAAVVDALARAGGVGVQAHLLRRLAAVGDDLQLGVYLLEALAHTGAQLPAAQLLPYVRQRQLARFVYPLLGLSHDLEAVEPLAQAACAELRGHRRAAVPALGRLVASLPARAGPAAAAALGRQPQAAAWLTEALEDDDPAVCGAAMQLLGWLQVAAAAPAILRRGTSLGLVQPAVEAAVRLGGAAAAPLLAGLDRVDVQSQLLYLDVIEAVGGSEAVEPLLDACQAAHAHLAAAAVRVLGALGDGRIVAPLMRLVDERDEPEVVRQVALALGALGRRQPDAVIPAVRRSLATGSVAPAWLTVLGALALPEDYDALVAACGHREPAVRVAALDALAAYAAGPPEAVLLPRLADPHPAVRAAAVRVAAGRATPATEQALLASLHDPDPWVVAQAAQGLGRAQASAALPALMGLARHPLAPVAIAAMGAAAALAPAQRAAIVAAGLGHADSEVVREAVNMAAALPAAQAAASCEAALEHAAWDVRAAAVEVLHRNALALPSARLRDRLAADSSPLVRARLQALLTARGEGA